VRQESNTTAGRGPALLRWVLLLVAVFAFVWAVVRASVQAIALDEADTYFWFVLRPGYVWYAFPNNHLLNTMLMWVTTHLFGTSILTVRMPALLGAAIYISSCYFLCRSVVDRFVLQISVFVCLVFNPFIFDFMVAARGYSLANAFLVVAIAIPVWHQVKGWPSIGRSCALASLALGLSFTASFSYAFVDLAVFGAIAIWAIRRRGSKSIARITGFCVMPGLLIALLLCGYTLAHWNKADLIYGSQSLGEMTRSLVDASLYQLNPRFARVSFLKPWLLPVLGILVVCRMVTMRLDGWVERLGAALVGITAITIFLHWLAFHLVQLPMPLYRTAVFLLILGTLAAGVIAAAPARSRVSEWLRRGITVSFVCLAVYFLLCLRVSYFKEYQYDADIKDVYSVLARLNHKYGVADVVVDGLYVNPLNFYRVLSKKETFPEFLYVAARQLPVGKSVYVLFGPYEDEFINKEDLVVIYRGKNTEVVVAVPMNGHVPPIKVAP